MPIFKVGVDALYISPSIPASPPSTSFAAGLVGFLVFCFWPFMLLLFFLIQLYLFLFHCQFMCLLLLLLSLSLSLLA
jgi:hypothetical protein